MSHDTDPTPNPTGHSPDQPTHPAPLPAPPTDDVFDLAELADPVIPPLDAGPTPASEGAPAIPEAEEVPPLGPPVAEGVVSPFDLPEELGDDQSIVVPLAELPDLPAELPAASGAGEQPEDFAIEEYLPTAEPVSGGEYPVAEAIPYGDAIAPGESASSLFGPAHPLPGEAADLGNLEPLGAVIPGSGWLDSQAGELPIPPALDGKPDQGDEANLAEALPIDPRDQGSDIFATGPAPAARLIDNSDVIAVTAYGDATPANLPPLANPSRPSEVALTFDQPPGGSTIQDQAAAADLPVAEEYIDPHNLLSGVGPGDGPLDSAELAEAPSLWEEPDYGAAVLPGADASSILADLTHQKSKPEDSSGIHLESPGVEATLSNDSPGAGHADFNPGQDEEMLSPGFAQLWDSGKASPSGDDDDQVDWADPSGSDLFADARKNSNFELIPDADQVDPFGDDLTTEQPSLSSSQSSIFTGGPVPTGTGPSGPSADRDVADAVEFTDHPEIGGVDSLHQPSEPGWIEFEPAEDLANADMTRRSPIPPEELEANWLTAPATPLPGQGPKPPSDRVHLPPGLTSTLFGQGLPGPLSEGPLAAELPPGALTNVFGTPPPTPNDADEIDWASDGDPNLTQAFEAQASGPVSGIIPREKAPTGGTGSHSTADLSLDDLVTDAPAIPGLTPVRPGSSSSFPQIRLPKTDSSGEASRLGLTQPANYGAFPGTNSDPSLVMDVVSDSGLADSVPETRQTSSRAKPRRRGDRSDETPSAPSTPGNVNRRAMAGIALGLLIGIGTASGVYFSGLLDDKTSGTSKSVAAGPNSGVVNPGPSGPTGPVVPVTPAAPVTLADAQTALNAGDPARAIKMIEATGGNSATAEAKAALGQARLFARLQGDQAAIPADDSELKKARTDLEAAAADTTPAGEKAAIQATLHLGLTYEVVGDQDGAEKVYKDAITKFPNAATLFQTALERLAALKQDKEQTSLRLTPAEAQRLVTAVVILVALADPPAVKDAPPEAGALFWKATNAAVAKKYDVATELIAKAKTAHQARARALAGRGLNPESDPLEQIFPRCCDDLKAFWELQKSLYDHPDVGALVKKEGVSKALATLSAAEKRAADLKKETEILAAEVTKANDKTATVEKELKAMLEKVKTEATKQAELADQDRVTARQAFDKLAAEKKELEATRDSVAKDLQTGKFLPEKYDDAAIRAATRTAVARANGPDLTKLIPSDLAAVAGAGFVTGNLLDLAARVNKAEVASKAAAAEVEKITARFKEDEKRLVAAHATELKKAEEAGTIATAKLKESHAAELTTLADKYAADRKKVDDAHAAAVAALEKAVAAEKAIVAGAEKRFQADLANAISPAQALDLWLPILTDLRRPTDAEPAMEAANKVLKTAPPGSEDAAKAQTVVGLAQLLKGDGPGAKAAFDLARGSAAYTASAGKGWVKAADTGAASVIDPTAPVRLTIANGPRKDPVAAARFLDVGVTAYKEGRYSDAEKALADSALNNPADAVAWYFLGAAKWATGKAGEARKDFRQGAERELARTVPVRLIDDAISPIQGPARDALTAARP